MAEPTVPLVASSAVAAVVMELLGIDSKPLLWGFIGSACGLSLPASEMTRKRAAVMFFAAALLSAIAGAMVARRWLGGEVLYASGIAGLGAVLFFPVVNAVVARVQGVVDELLRKVGLHQQKESGNG